MTNIYRLLLTLSLLLLASNAALAGAGDVCSGLNALTPVKVTLDGQEFGTTINFYDYKSVANGTRHLVASALAAKVPKASLTEKVLAQLTDLVKKMAIHGNFFVKVPHSGIDYPTLDLVCDKRDPTGIKGAMPGLSVSELQVDNPGLIRQLQQSTSPK